MKLISYDIHAPKHILLDALTENDRIVKEEKFDLSKGVPRIHIKEKGDRINIKCEFIGRATKDNAFLEGTYLVGRLRENNGVTSLRGIILTAPIYHAVLCLIFIYFVIQCIITGGFTPVPIILLGFSIFMFRDEFRKQGIIKRYIFRAFKNTFNIVNSTRR